MTDITTGTRDILLRAKIATTVDTDIEIIRNTLEEGDPRVLGLIGDIADVVPLPQT